MRFETKKRILLCTAVAYLCLAAAVCAVRFLTLLNAVDPATGFSVLPYPPAQSAELVFLIGTLLLLLVSVWVRVPFTRKEDKRELGSPLCATKKLYPATALFFPAESAARTFASAFFGFSLITFSLFSLTQTVSTVTPRLFIWLLAILSGIFFLLKFTPILPLYSARRVLASLLPVLWSAALLAVRFLEASRVATGEYHFWQILSLILLPLFFYSLTLFSLPKPAAHRFSLFYFTALAGSACLLIFTLPTIFLSSFWCYTAYTEFSSLYELILLLAAAIYQLIFLFAVLHSLRQIDSEEALLSRPPCADSLADARHTDDAFCPAEDDSSEGDVEDDTEDENTESDNADTDTL